MAADMQDEYTINVTPGRKSSRFSQRELGDIAVAMVVLSIAFMILYRNSQYAGYLTDEFGSGIMWVLLFVTCLGLVFFSFLLHEFGHKFTAQNFGMRSEFRMYPLGLVITLVSSFMGFLFAAPGAVVIAGYPDKRENGIISIAGPAVNIVLAAIGIAGCFAFNHTPLVFIFLMLANLNAFLALFNLLPIPPLDGSKIWNWNLGVYIVAIGVAALMLVYMYAWMPALYYG